MKIVLDNIIFNLQNAGGISTYWGELVKRFLRDNLDVTFIERDAHNNIVRQALDIDFDLIENSSKYGLLVDRFRKIDLSHLSSNFIFHSSYNRVSSNPYASQVITIHDFIHEKFYKGARRLIHSNQKKRAVNNAKKIIAISENTKNDILDYYKDVDPQNIKVIYNGVSDDFFPLSQTGKQSGRPFFLFIGSTEKYKNFDFVIQLLEIYPDFDLQLVGCRLSPGQQRTLESKLPNRWRLATGISNFELNIIYNNAYALLYPSSYEGFGIPILEAMKVGCPFLALNRSSIPEVAGEAGILLEQLDLQEFSNGILRIEADRRDLMEKGFKQSEKFSWEKCYHETISLYKELT